MFKTTNSMPKHRPIPGKPSLMTKPSMAMPKNGKTQKMTMDSKMYHSGTSECGCKGKR